MHKSVFYDLFSSGIFFHLVDSHIIDPFNTVLPTRLDMSYLPSLYQGGRALVGSGRTPRKL
jgi:hypothetical protein